MPAHDVRAILGRFYRCTLGGVGTIAAFALPATIIAAGSALDLARIGFTKAELQAALDAGALSGAVKPAAERQTAAQGAFDAIIASKGLSTVTSWTTNSNGSFTGTATATVPATLLKVVGLSNLSISATSTAIASTSTSSTPTPTPSTAKSCIIVLSKTASQALLVNTPVDINASKCMIDVHSTASPAAIFNAGFKQNLNKICVKGTNVIQNGGTVTNLQTGCTPAADPYASQMPTVSVGACTVSDQNYAGANTLVPGVYCGNFNFNGSGTLNLQPGLYILKNTRWNLNSGWKVNGTGVTFYLADSNSYIQINSGVAMTVTAPTSGTYKDLLMFEKPGLSNSAFTINGSAGHQFQGLFYLPSRDITFNSVSTVQSEKITFVFNTLILDHIAWDFEDAGFGTSGSPSTSSTSSATSTSSVRLVK